jgi:small-conductance mechanosensitive channel
MDRWLAARCHWLGFRPMVRLLTTLMIPTADEPSPTPSDVIEPIDLRGNITDVEWWVDLATGPVLRSVFIVIVALIARIIVNKIINGFVKGLTAAAESNLPGVGAASLAREVGGEDYLQAERRANRTSTLGRLLKNVASVAILSIAALMILAEWGFNLAPLVAGAGILGVAIGFGAQALVSDFLSGVFMLLEDQYGVGDIIDLDGTEGTVEDVQLRVTRLRSVNGVVWWVRNGEVTRVGNMSQNWSRAVLDIGVGYGSDIAQVRELMGEEARRLNGDEEWAELLLEEPEVWGVESLGNDAVVVRLVLKTLPGQQWQVARELRERIKVRFDAEGIEIPFPQRTVWLRQESGA